MTTFVGHLVSRIMKQFAYPCFTCIFYIALLLIYSSTLSFPQFPTITKLNVTNYKNGKNKLSDNHLVNVCCESNIIDISFDT